MYYIRIVKPHRMQFCLVRFKSYAAEMTKCVGRFSETRGSTRRVYSPPPKLVASVNKALCKCSMFKNVRY